MCSATWRNRDEVQTALDVVGGTGGGGLALACMAGLKAAAGTLSSHLVCLMAVGLPGLKAPALTARPAPSNSAATASTPDPVP